MKFHHKRYTEIPLSGEHREDKELRLVLFNKEAKLRSHAVKHLTNLTESETTWKGLSHEDRLVVTETIRGLQDLGCPFFVLKTSAPPCDAGHSGCRLYASCTPVVESLQEIYLRAVAEFVREGAHVPRVARYYSDRDDNEAISIMPDRPVVIKAALLARETYNLVTCYGGVDQSFQEMRDQQLEMVRSEARRRNILLNEGFAWGCGRDDPDRNAGEEDEDNARSRKGKGRRMTRFRGGAASWRRFLGDAEPFD